MTEFTPPDPSLPIEDLIGITDSTLTEDPLLAVRMSLRHMRGELISRTDGLIFDLREARKRIRPELYQSLLDAEGLLVLAQQTREIARDYPIVHTEYTRKWLEDLNRAITILAACTGVVWP